MKQLFISNYDHNFFFFQFAITYLILLRPGFKLKLSFLLWLKNFLIEIG